jgi:hypothetical protein
MGKDISRENAQQIAVEYVRRRKNTEKIDVAAIEENSGSWVIRGTCPIDMEGHPWAEKFEVIIDSRGKIRDTNSALL